MPAHRRFRDRTEAGNLLAEALAERGVDADLVLAIPRGGLPLGRAIADAFGAPLDVVVAKKIGAPGNPEFAIGAVASDGSVWRNEDAIRSTGATESYFERERAKATENARQKLERYRGERPPPDVRGKTIVVVDDGVATGATAKACLEQLRGSGADRVVLAVPVGPPDSIRELAEIADEVLCIETPASFGGVGQFYDRFEQVSDREAAMYLEHNG